MVQGKVVSTRWYRQTVRLREETARGGSALHAVKTVTQLRGWPEKKSSLPKFPHFLLIYSLLPHFLLLLHICLTPTPAKSSLLVVLVPPFLKIGSSSLRIFPLFHCSPKPLGDPPPCISIALFPCSRQSSSARSRRSRPSRRKSNYPKIPQNINNWRTTLSAPSF